MPQVATPRMSILLYLPPTKALRLFGVALQGYRVESRVMPRIFASLPRICPVWLG
jgi:hypothetical protein